MVGVTLGETPPLQLKHVTGLCAGNDERNMPLGICDSGTTQAWKDVYTSGEMVKIMP